MADFPLLVDAFCLRTELGPLLLQAAFGVRVPLLQLAERFGGAGLFFAQLLFVGGNRLAMACIRFLLRPR